jgi:hypothetical protein
MYICFLNDSSKFIMKRIFTLFGVLMFIGINFTSAQITERFKTKVVSFNPYFGYSYSQLDIVNTSFEAGFGFFDQNAIYAQAVVGVTRGSSLSDEYNRKTTFTGINPGLRIKYKIFGPREYIGAAYFQNMRLTADAGLFLHMNYTQAQRGETTVVDELGLYPSFQWGGSIMIPYPFTLKFSNRFFNRTDLFFEVLHKTYLSKNVSKFHSKWSEIDAVTAGYRIGLNLVYYIR